MDHPLLGVAAARGGRVYPNWDPSVSILLNGRAGKEEGMKIYCVKPPRFIRSLIELFCRK